MKKFKVGPDSAGIRADVFITGKYPEFSRSSLEAILDSGKVYIAKKPVKGSYKTKAGDIFSVDDALLFAKPPKINLPVIYEDDDVIAIDKPAGILTHSKGALNSEATVASFIRPKVSNELTGNRAGIVHRLDRGTSGVIITAKNEKALKWLQKQFSNRKVKKTYLAVVEGLPTPSEAIIDIPLARNPAKPQSFKASSQGKAARTSYKVLKTFNSPKSSSLLEVRPQTGRTHQIRVHLAYIGHPIVGDGLYGRGSDKMLLHAKSLELSLSDGVHKTFTAPAPNYFGEFSK